MKYDVIDLGSGRGGCLEFSIKKFKATSHLGIEIQQDRVVNLKKRGYNCIHGDIVDIVLPEKSSRIVTISHVLEHLNSYSDVEKVLHKAIKTATEFVYIDSPCFDFDDYLEKLGLKFFWSDWKGHKTKYHQKDILHTLKNTGIDSCDVLVETPYVVDSSSECVHPLSSPVDQFNYNKEIHAKKPFCTFPDKIYKSYTVFAWVRNKYRNVEYLKTRSKFKELNYTRLNGV